MKNTHLKALTEEQRNAICRMQLIKSIPRNCFERSLLKSLYFGFRDYVCVVACYIIFNKFQTYNVNLYLQVIAYIFYAFIQGFFCWCIFVVGHDCGHGSFSNYPMINALMGHIFHGSIYVPFWPWALSHSRHHQNHNHIEKDYSNPWHAEAKDCGSSYMSRFVLPLVAWPVYLIFGQPDGTHFLPLKTQRLYGNASIKESVKCIVSSAVVFLWIFIYRSIFGTWGNTAFYTAGPFLGFGYWLLTVTYFQHHGDFSIVYDDETWNYEMAAFQTIDRSYGSFIDYFHHRITDCHVIHHLFYLTIPHYHLREATDALLEHLKKHDLLWLYQFEPTRDFATRVFFQMGKQGLAYKHYVKGKQN